MKNSEMWRDDKWAAGTLACPSYSHEPETGWHKPGHWMKEERAELEFKQKCESAVSEVGKAESLGKCS
jgi:hypothetical protein